MEDLRSLCEDLRALGRRKPTPSARRTVEAALAHKREGVQAVASEALAEWGDPDSVAQLRSWLRTCMIRPNGWGITGVAVRSLAKCVSDADAPWILDGYFKLGVGIYAHSFLPLVLALPHDSKELRVRLASATCHADADRRRAALKIVGGLRCRDRNHLLKQFLEDPDSGIRHTAGVLLAQEP